MRTNKPETYATFMPPQPGQCMIHKDELDKTTDLRNTISPLQNNIFAKVVHYLMM